MDAGGVIVQAFRLLARHWPALLAVFLAAMIARELFFRAAVRVSVHSAELGLLILLFAPMTTLTALVLMLRVVRPSLPWLGRQGSPPSMLVHLGSVLVPFMTIYYFEDALKEDMLDYSYRVWEDFATQIFVNAAESVDTGAATPDTPTTLERLPYDLSLPLVAVVVAAIIGRWLLGRWPAAQRRGWLGLPGAYLELVWITLVMVLAFQAISDLLIEWSSTLRVGSAVVNLWEHGVGTASGATSAPEAAIDWLLSRLGHVEAVLVIPLSWLAIGAVVIGYRPPDRWTPGRANRGQRAYQRAERRWLAAPRAIRWTGERVTEDLRGRFAPLVRGVRMLWRAGAVPMLLFCLAFVAARRLSDWLWQLERALVGPQELSTVWVPLAWPLSTVNEAVGTAVLICLLAAAVDRALRYSQPAADPPDLVDSVAAELPATATVSAAAPVPGARHLNGLPPNGLPANGLPPNGVPAGVPPVNTPAANGYGRARIPVPPVVPAPPMVPPPVFPPPVVPPPPMMPPPPVPGSIAHQAGLVPPPPPVPPPPAVPPPPPVPPQPAVPPTHAVPPPPPPVPDGSPPWAAPQPTSSRT